MFFVSTYVKSAQHSYVECQKLQWNDTKDSLETIDTAGYPNEVRRMLLDLRVHPVTDHDGPTLLSKTSKTPVTL